MFGRRMVTLGSTAMALVFIPFACHSIDRLQHADHPFSLDISCDFHEARASSHTTEL
jgi:hypothetical protein